MSRNPLWGNSPQQPPARRPAPGAGGYAPSPQGSYGAPSSGYGSPASGYGREPPRQQQPPRGYPPQGGAPGGGRRGPSMPVVHLGADKSASESDTWRNLAVVSPQDFNITGGDAVHISGRFIYILLDGRYVLSARADPVCPPGRVLLNIVQREMCGTNTTGQGYDGPKDLLAELSLELSFAGSKNDVTQSLDQDALAKAFNAQFSGDMLARGQKGLWEWKDAKDRNNVRIYRFTFTVKAVTIMDSTTEKPLDNENGMVNANTVINFSKAGGDKNAGMKFMGSTTRPAANAILRPDFKFADMGIGGLDEEFSTIFRRAFASRVFPPGLVQQMGISHVKGILLYGPPGTGKTLIARQIGKMLNAREPVIINGPEILNKYVGASEENVRKMFKAAEDEYKAEGDESGLHIIIFDELDAVCKQRGSGAGGGTGVGDSVVNQLLSKLDGVDQLNNILLIGMTNRKDMIDDALLRPGRLEVHMEISLPDEAGRVQILGIHTAKIRAINKLGADVNLNELAKLTKNYSGAELNGLVKAALSYAFTRHTKLGDVTGVQGNPEDVMLTWDDLLNALEDVKPAFGVSEEELESAAPYGIVHYSPHIKSILANGQNFVEQLRTPGNAPLFSVLVHGPRGAGKTALAAEIGLKSEFPFVKLVRPIDVGTSEAGKLEFLRRTFSDAYKSANSIVILDRIETLIDWNPIGPRFSNAVVQYLSALLQTTPPNGRRLLIIATTGQRTMLEQHGTLEFDREIAVPAVKDLPELHALLQASGKVPDNVDLNETLNELSQMTGTQEVGIGVKAVFSAIETALVRRDQPLTQSLAVELSEIIATRNPHY